MDLFSKHVVPRRLISLQKKAIYPREYVAQTVLDEWARERKKTYRE